MLKHKINFKKLCKFHVLTDLHNYFLTHSILMSLYGTVDTIYLEIKFIAMVAKELLL